MVENEDCASAWRSAIRDITSYGEWVDGVRDSMSVGSNFGTTPRKFLELRSYALNVVNPRARTILSKLRPVNQSFCVANFLWAISGSSLLQDIEPFNTKARQFAVDGRLDSAPGVQVWGGSKEQWETLISRLNADPSTRRAVLQFSDFSNFHRSQRDVPCMQTMQFLLRGRKLHCLVSMRSQSALMVMPYDLFLCTMIHELVAATVGVELGSFTQFVGSMHVYEDELELTSKVISGDPPPSLPPMPPMTYEDAKLIELVGRRYLRLARSERGPVDSSLVDGLTGYWASLFTLLTGREMTSLSNVWRTAFGFKEDEI